MTTSLQGKTVIVTGASRGIGRAIALRCAKAGANVAVLAKTATPNPKLKGTIFTVADEIEACGQRALPLQVDLRDDQAVAKAIHTVADTFGGIDILVNNAGVLNITDTLNTPMKRFDLMTGVNVRATFAASQAAIPFLKHSENPHILTISPPINLEPKWFEKHLAYTISKYGMSMCTLGMAKEFAKDRIAVNSLWPQTAIATAAIEVHFPKAVYEGSRKPEIMADAAYIILTTDSQSLTGQFYTDEGLLREKGCEDFSIYAINQTAPLFTDAFVE